MKDTIKRTLLLIFCFLTLLTSCGHFSSLPDDPSYIQVTRYHMDFSDAETRILKGKQVDDVYQAIKWSGKHKAPKNKPFSCPAALSEESWTYDIVIHSSNEARLFVQKVEGCTFIRDPEDDLLLYSNIDMSRYFQ